MTDPTTHSIKDAVPSSHHDLLDATVASLATVGPDYRPQVSAVWFLADDDAVRVSLNTDRQKVRNLRANPAVNLFILDLENPMRYLELRGDARLENDEDDAFAARVGEKYDADLRAFDGPGAHRVVVTIEPTTINAVDLSGG
jgi:PPOX class probable F420-dependent enzyme